MRPCGSSYHPTYNNGSIIRTNGIVTEYSYNEFNQLISETRATISSGQDVTVEEYEYDYAGNRTAKITEEKTIKYVVDTNGALAQVLYEIDEAGNLTTFYTRGAELLTLEREGELRYYLYDGHGSVRHLTDEAGTVTDTYDYDAFGNLTAQTGDTENSYMYCGEQYDANTGFYYLRARNMNPGTGTFISLIAVASQLQFDMSSYQGSMFDPVSLHKYLYANANPVMYTDPTGYFSLSDLQITQKINAVLTKISTPNVLLMLKKANTVATIYDTVCQVMDMIRDADGSALEVAWAIGRGILTGIFINKMCALKTIGPVVSKLAIGFGIVSQVTSIIDAAKEGQWDRVAARTIQLIAMVVSLGQSCFTGDTLVATEEGQRRIDQVKVGCKRRNSTEE